MKSITYMNSKDKLLNSQHLTPQDKRALYAYEQWRKDEGLRLVPEYTRRDHTRGVHLRLEFQGHLVKVGLRGMRPPIQPEKRGKITGFSAASRRRMMELVQRLGAEKSRVFVTLTYGADFPTPKDAKQHLRAFLERIRRKFSDKEVSAIWRIELQERGAPHFHLMFFKLPFLPKEDLQKMWGEVIGQERPFTRIEFIRSHKGVASYVAKYMTKQESAETVHSGFNYVSYLHDIGRIWGIFNAKFLPLDVAITVTYPFLGKAITKFRHYAILKWPELANREHFGFTLYVKDAYKWLELWEKISDIKF